MTTISIQSKYSIATIECAKGYIRFYNGQLVDAYEALRADFFDTVQHWNDDSLKDQHVTIMRCVRDMGYNAGVLVKGHGRVIFSGIILDDTQATITVLNPWTQSGIPKVTTIADVLRSIETFAAAEECEAVNNVFSSDNAFDWVKTFEEVHGLDRLSAIAFS